MCECKLTVNSRYIPATFRLERQRRQKSEWMQLGVVHLVIDFVWKRKESTVRKYIGSEAGANGPVN